MTDKKPELPCGEITLPGIFYNGTNWVELDDEMSNSEPPVEKTLTCECGASSINSIGHAVWCPLGENKDV